MPDQYYAHSLPGRPSAEWQPLEEHLKNVACLARKFANYFWAGDNVYIKYKPGMEVIWHEEYDLRN